MEKSQLSLPVLINALFCDLAIEKDFKLPTQPEKRERVLRDLFYGVFDENTRTLHYVNAGHNSAVVIRRGGGVAWLEASAPPVGLFAETVYQAQAVQLCREIS